MAFRAAIAAAPERLAEAKRLFLDSSMADREGGRRSSQGRRWWFAFRVYVQELTPIPDSRRMREDFAYAAEIEDALEDCAVWIATARPSGRQCSRATIGKYISEVRAWYFREHRVKLGLGAEGSRISSILKGYAREVPQPPPLEREGCTPADLAAGMAVVLGDGSPSSLMWRAALTVAESGLMRGCEFALDGARREAFQSSEHVEPADVSFFTRAGTRHASLRMRKRKDLKVLRGKQSTVLLAGGGGGFFDAVGELEAWLEVRRGLGPERGMALFCHPDGRSITVDEVRAMVRRVMEAAGRDPRRFGAHSLRIGGATAALAAGVQPQLIRLMGRWSSDIYEIYCRMSVEAALGVGAAIASATVTPLAQAFTDEHLEVLPHEMLRYSDAFGIDGAEEEEE